MGTRIKGPGGTGWQERLFAWFGHAADLLHQKMSSFVKSGQLLEAASPLAISGTVRERLRHEWQKGLKAGGAESPLPDSLTDEEDRLIRAIREQTEAGNRNNVTRTAAYLDVYRRSPELHWAFLAHMVSRNGGWSMTDLQGYLLPRLLDEQRRQGIFLFLERANALIFQDAYPQLLIYEASKRAGRSLFRLLPAFHVSRFMGPVWELFLREKHSPALTVGLIINEQNYIQGRVVENGFYQQNALDTIAFQIQSLLQLNQVFFPYGSSPEGGSPGDSPRRLAGLVLENFADLQERIGVGKRLYGMLFGIPEILRGAERFAMQHSHTGSRADYWPHLFSPVRKAPPSKMYEERLEGCTLRKGAPPLYSPPLRYAWKDQAIGSVERYDWFRDLAAAEGFSTAEAPDHTDMTGEACTGLAKIELAVVAAVAAGVK